MYSHADRICAVELYIELGMRLKAPSQSNSLSARMMRTSDGTMKSASNYHWGRSARSNIEEVSALTYKSVQAFIRIPLIGVQYSPPAGD